MWPWEHLALGYLAVSLFWRLNGHEVDGWVAGVVVLGTQFPDVVDKSLAWYVGFLPAGRSLTHTLFVAAPVSVFAIMGAVVVHRGDWGLAFAISYMSHLLGDALPKLVQGNYEALTFLLWPLLPLPDYEGLSSILESARALIVDPTTYLSVGWYRVAVVAFVVVLWAADGFPGVLDVGRYLSRNAQLSE